MRSIRPHALLLAALLVLSHHAAAQAPSLTCQVRAGSDAAGCKVSHFHVRAYRPDTKTFVELTGVNEFASPSACETGLANRRQRNWAVVEYMKKAEPRAQFQPDMFGQCHCDMTRSRGSANFLEDAQRVSQLRMQQDVTARVRERLLDADALPNSEVVLGLGLAPSSFDPSFWPKTIIVPDPAELKAPPPPIAESRVLMTTVGDELPRTSTSASLDVALVDVEAPKDVQVTRAIAPSGLESASPDQPAATEPAEETPAAATPAGESPADAFVSYETARVTAIFSALGQIEDAALKKSIYEASNARLQLLSNLKRIVQAAGSRSKLAAAVQAASVEPARLALAKSLFGEQVAAHWAPADARGIVILVPAELTGDPVTILRESMGQYDTEQKKLTVYYLLGKSTSLTSSQELWLADLMESFL